MPIYAHDETAETGYSIQIINEREYKRTNTTFSLGFFNVSVDVACLKQQNTCYICVPLYKIFVINTDTTTVTYIIIYV